MGKIIKLLTKGLHSVAQIILLVMMLLITFDVLGRWLFNHPIKGTVDVTEIALCMIVFLSIGYAHLEKVHITIDFVVDKLPKKVQLIFDIVINILIAAVMGIITYSLWQNADRLMRSGTVSSDLNLPIYLFSILAAIGTIIFSLIAILFAIENTRKILKSTKVKDENFRVNSTFSQQAVNSNES